MDSTVKVVLVCVCMFILYQIKSALVLSSVSMCKPLSFPWKTQCGAVGTKPYNYGRGCIIGLSREESAIPGSH